MRRKKILITGGNGFVGKYICKHIKCDNFKGDITDKNTFPNKKYDIIIHCAAKISHTGDITDDKMFDVNVNGTKNICEFYKSKIIYISTVDVEGEKLSYYAQTKLEAEKIVSKNIDNLIVRLPSVFGKGTKQTNKLIPKLIRFYFNSEPLEIKDENDIREYIYVNEVAERIARRINEVGIISLLGTKISNFNLQWIIHEIYESYFYKNFKGTKFANQLKECCI